MIASRKQDVATAAQRVKKNGKRIPIRSNGRIIAALVPVEDLRDLEAMDRLDARIAKRALARAEKRGEKPIPWSHVRDRLMR